MRWPACSKRTIFSLSRSPVSSRSVTGVPGVGKCSLYISRTGRIASRKNLTLTAEDASWEILLSQALLCKQSPRNTKESEEHSSSAGVQAAGPLASAERADTPSAQVCTHYHKESGNP